MTDQEKSYYFIKRHNIRLLEEESDVFNEAHLKRKLLALNFHSSIQSASNASTCHLLENDLEAYASVVDCRGAGKVNNYADATLALASHCKNGTKEWKSNLIKIKDEINDIIDRMKCQDCSNWNVPKQMSNLFLGSSDDSGGNLSPPRVRKNSEKSLSSLTELPKLSVPTSDTRLSTSVTPLPGIISKPEVQPSKFKSDLFMNRSEFSTSSNPLTKNIPGQACPPPLLGRPNLNMVRDEPPANFSKNMFTRPVFNGNLPDGGHDWNVGKPANSRNDSTGYNNDGNYFSNAPYDREFEKNGRGSSSGRRGGRDSFTSGARKNADDQYRNLQDGSDAGMSSAAANFFKTARDELVDQNAKKNNGVNRGQGGGYPRGCNNYENGSNGNPGAGRGGNLLYGALKRSLGTSRRGGGLFNKFVPPVRPAEEEEQNNSRQAKRNNDSGEDGEVDERLKNIDPKMIELIRNEIMDISAPVSWDDIAGLEFAKSTIQEIVVWPMLRPDIFTGLRKPPKGLLLFGPPGTGKTLIGKCIASQSQSTFFSISASSLTSKWIGDGEKMVRALFAVAKCHQPAVVFIDEIDSLLTQRSDTEHESSRRIKTEFLVQLDGAGTGDEERILVVGATNRPQELDEAARRRLVKRLYIPLPEFQARKQIVERLMSSERNDLTHEEIDEIARLSAGYSGADMKNLCQEASLGPIRSLSSSDMQQITADQVRPVNFHDFKTALHRVRASVSQKDLDQYITWDQTYGMSGAF